MRTKQLFKTRLLSFAALCCLALAAVSCANEDIAQNGTGSDNNKDFTTFVASEPTKTRTSMDYATGNFYWEEGDKIYVQDDDGHWQTSNAVDAAHAHSTSFRFKVPGKFKNSATYKVYYLGKNSSNNQVTIPTEQKQSTPNSTKHLGDSGDYATATATGTLGGSMFSFQLEHQATYLIFKPYTSNDVLKYCYLTKIEVNSDNNIAETYTIDPVSGNMNSSAGSKQIVLTTKDPISSSVNQDGFPLTNSSPDIITNGAYMLIKPGTHTLKVRYWVKDIATNVEGVITKILPSFNYDKNTYYDMTANLNVINYDGDHYYMWDAQQQYWSGHEWLSANKDQPILNGNSNSNYAQSNSDNRWYHEGSGAFQATNSSCKNLPNANEMTWYCMKGDPRWDEEQLWATMGHLHKGGMWFLKKTYISGYRDDKAFNGTDFRTTTAGCGNLSPSMTLPSTTDANKYFFLPALGYYDSGKLGGVGKIGYYWSSSTYPKSGSGIFAYNFAFMKSAVYVSEEVERNLGFRVQPLFE